MSIYPSLITPPHNLEAEEALLGSVLIDPDTYASVATLPAQQVEPGAGEVAAGTSLAAIAAAPLTTANVERHGGKSSLRARS